MELGIVQFICHDAATMRSADLHLIRRRWFLAGFASILQFVKQAGYECVRCRKYGRVELLVTNADIPGSSTETWCLSRRRERFAEDESSMPKTTESALHMDGTDGIRGP